MFWEKGGRESEASFVSLLCITKLTFATGDSSVVGSRDLAKVATRVRIPAFAWRRRKSINYLDNMVLRWMTYARMTGAYRNIEMQ